MHANQVERILVWCFSQTSQLLGILNKQTNNNIPLGSRIENRNLIIFYMQSPPLILSRSRGSSMLLCINMFIFNFHLTSTCSPNYLFPSNPLIKIHYFKLVFKHWGGWFQTYILCCVVQVSVQYTLSDQFKCTLVLHIINK